MRDLLDLLAPAERDQLLRQGAVGTLAAGQHLADTAERFVRVDSGVLAVQGSFGSGRLLMLGPGDAWVASLYHPWPALPYRLVARTACRLLTAPLQSVEAVASRNPQFALALLEQAALEGYWAIQLLDLAERPPEERTAFVLLNLAALFGFTTADGSIDLGVRVTQEELAEFAGCSRATLAEALRVLAREKLVRPTYGGLRIVDAGRLAERTGAAILPFFRTPRLRVESS